MYKPDRHERIQVSQQRHFITRLFVHINNNICELKKIDIT